MSQVFGDPKRLVNDYMAGSHAIGITSKFGAQIFVKESWMQEILAQLQIEGNSHLVPRE